MAYIKVDFNKMQDAANTIDDYVARMNRNMHSIDTGMQVLGTQWQGEDYRQVKLQWDEINASGSTTYKMRTTLQSYAGCIREASKQYKDAQTRAINRANTLCK